MLSITISHEENQEQEDLREGVSVSLPGIHTKTSDSIYANTLSATDY